MSSSDFSARSRSRALQALSRGGFDLLVVGGGITGAAVARDAATRGMRVALIEKDDFSQGTSSRSSKLVHGGLRYLENLEFGLVFEALSERTLLLRTQPHLVHPLPFYFPVYEGAPRGRFLVGLGLWFYDLLSLFRTPGWHRSLSREKFLSEVPGLKSQGLRGGFRYYDACMWDDVMVLELLRDAARRGAAVASRVEAVRPLWREGGELGGFQVRDHEAGGKEFSVRARQTVICAGPWTDSLGQRMDGAWKSALQPSKGVHLVFDAKRLPVPGALVMTHPSDGRISFVMPRMDLGAGVTIVGTTDGPTPAEPEKASVDPSDTEYLLQLLQAYFPEAGLTQADIISSYVGVRPLLDPRRGAAQEGQGLAKVSREHEIWTGPGGAVFVAGGKYTTHRKMAEEIVDAVLKEARLRGIPADWRKPDTTPPPNPEATPEALQRLLSALPAEGRARTVREALVRRYGAEADEVEALEAECISHGPVESRQPADPEGFPCLRGQFLFQMRHGSVLRLEDFYRRRVPLYLARADHGLPWAESLSWIWAWELQRTEAERQAELQSLRESFSQN